MLKSLQIWNCIRAGYLYRTLDKMLQAIKSGLFLALFTVQLTACAHSNNHETQKTNDMTETLANGNNLDTATFGAGCFWCTEAQFQQLKGVEKVVSGYSGGNVPNPTYDQVCTGTTGHAEVCNIYYDPTVISFDDLLQAFWLAHDPTQLNRQGNDVGTQYRSAVFYHNEEQKSKAEQYIKKLNDEKAFDKPVVTEVAPYKEFYKAENYHQNYYNENSSQPYCTFVVGPKVEKFKKVFKDRLKEK